MERRAFLKLDRAESRYGGAIYDLIVLVAAGIVFFVIAASLNLSERVIAFLSKRQLEIWQLDEYVLVLVFLAFAFALFSYRRWLELRQEYLRFELAASAVSAAVYDWDIHGGTIVWGSGLTEVFGFPRDEAFSSDDFWLRHLHPEDRARVSAAFDESVQSGKDVDVDYRFLAADGSYRHVLDRGRIIKEPNGRVVRMVGSMVDITEKEKAEEVLRQSQERLQSIVNSEPECVKVVAADGSLLEMNPAGLGMIAASSADVLGKSVYPLVHPEDLGAFRALHERVLSGNSGKLEFRMLDLLGRMHWMESNSVPLRENDRISAVLSITRDITERKQAEEALLRSEERYRSLLLQSGEGIYILDPQTKRIQEANPILLSMLGYTEKEITELSIYDLVALSREGVDRGLQTLLETGAVFVGSRKYRRKDGSTVDVEIRASLVSYGDSRVVLVNVTDISERRRAEALQSALYRIAEKTASSEVIQELYAGIHSIIGELMDAGNFYIALYDRDSDTISFPYFVDEEEEAPPGPQKAGKGMTEYVFRTGQPLLAPPEKFQQLLEAGEVDDIGAPSVDWLGVPLKAGEDVIGVLVVQSYTENVRYGERELGVLSFVSRHIATALDRKRAQETIRHHAYHDVLTLLPNRMLFRDRFLQAIAQANRNRQMLAMMFLDLDRFKMINDTLGHAVGDRLLQETATRLNRCLREGDTVARLGGDEFLVLAPGIHGLEDTAKIAEKILQELRPSFQFDGHDLHVTTSIGISIYPHDGEDVETLVKNADIALYRAKDAGRNNYQLYTPEMNARAYELLKMENSLRGALDRGEFVLYYQPQVCRTSGKLAGMEALVRWFSNGKIVTPGEFISVAEDTGIIVPMGEWVLREACRQNREWQEQGLEPVPVAVNISARQFQQQGLVSSIAKILEDSGVDSSVLELELTESVIMHDPVGAVDTLGELKDMGIGVCIDDFGTGYSSLSYLKRFPIDTLKIDQSFVRDCTFDTDDASIVTAVISLAHSLKMKVVAEGVETKEQLEFLQTQGCDVFQGYYFGRPVPADVFADRFLKGTTVAGNAAED